MAKSNAAAVDEKKLRRALIKRDWRMNKAVYLMALPVLAYFIIFNYVPMSGILMAFQNFSIKKE